MGNKNEFIYQAIKLGIIFELSVNHPKQWKVGIVLGQALRIIERCSDQKEADLHLENLQEDLLARNYPESVLDNK